jgi:N-glycosylase/DNA lyase
MDVRWTDWRHLTLADVPSPPCLAEILDGGQCFRWRLVDDIWTGVVGQQPLKLRASAGGVDWRQLAGTGDATKTLAHYLDAEGAQARVADALPWRSDPALAKAMERFRGLRILRQQPHEALLGFLCSSNKQILQIRRMVEALAMQLGPELAPGLHALPDWATLAKADDRVLKGCGLGYRATFIRETARALARHPGWAEEFGALGTEGLLEALAKLPGVGPKVAACTALFGFGRLDAFPVDTWIEQILVERYGLKGWKRAALERFGRAHYGDAAGLAQQYLFAEARDGGRSPPSRKREGASGKKRLR